VRLGGAARNRHHVFRSARSRLVATGCFRRLCPFNVEGSIRRARGIKILPIDLPTTRRPIGIITPREKRSGQSRRTTLHRMCREVASVRHATHRIDEGREIRATRGLGRRPGPGDIDWCWAREQYACV
jgi:hypothetical protein